MHTSSDIARRAAVAGGSVLLSMREAMGVVRAKQTATDFVTEADVASGIAVVNEILRLDPRARVIVEEPEVCEQMGIEPGALDDPEVWVIDPLDGTTSFVHGFPCYSVSVGLLREGRAVAGAVHNVSQGELFSAEVGQGAWKDTTPIRCSNAAAVSDALMVTGFPYDRGAPLDRQLSVLAAFLRSPVHGIRRDGSAANDCCHVAAGRADGFWEYTLKVWDMAAGVIICSEAGATVTDVEGAPWTSRSTSICTANPQLHAQMLDVIGSVG